MVHQLNSTKVQPSGTHDYQVHMNGMSCQTVQELDKA